MKKKFTKDELIKFIEEFSNDLDDQDKDEYYGTEKDVFEGFKINLQDYIKSK